MRDWSSAELQSLIQPLSGKVDYGAVEINQTFRINENFHPVGFKSGVVGFRLIDKFQNVSQTGAAGGFYANAYPLAPAATGQLSPYVLRSFRCEANCHSGILLVAIILHRRFDGVFSKHRAVNFDRRQGQLLRNLCVFDRRGLVEVFTLNPLREQ